MGFKSLAHKRKIQELVTQGKIKQAEFDRLAKITGNKKLPEYVIPKVPKK